MSRSGGSGVLAALVALVLSGLGVLASAPAASAHTSLVSSSPADGEALLEPPAQLVLTFDDDVVDLGSQVVVVGPDGAAVPATGPTVDGPTVTWSLATPPGATAPAGAYAVRWRVTAGDGHPIEGALTYTVASSPQPVEGEDPPSGGASDPAEPEVTTMGEDVAPGPGAAAGQGPSSSVGWVAAGLAAAGLAAAFLRGRRRS